MDALINEGLDEYRNAEFYAQEIEYITNPTPGCNCCWNYFDGRDDWAEYQEEFLTVLERLYNWAEYQEVIKYRKAN